MKIYDYLIVGGGVAGLSALHKIQKKTANVVLLEKDNSCGGLVKSNRDRGFLLETGPNAFLKGYKSTMEFVEELGLGKDVIYNIPGADNRFVYRYDQIHPIPEGPLSFVATKLFPWSTKFRLLLEPFVLRGKSGEETVYEFGKRRFGDDISSTVMDAMVSGICAGDFKKLDIFSLFPKIGVIEQKFRSFLLFLLLFKLKSKEKNKDNESVTFRSFKDGMGTIAARAQELYDDKIELNSSVDSIEFRDEIYTIKSGDKTYHTKHLVLATPANVATKLLSTAHSALSEKLSRIPYSSITTCLLGFDRSSISHPMNGFGFLIPRNQNKRILGGLFSSGLFQDRAPQSDASVKVYIGGAHDTDIQNQLDSSIEDVIVKELSPILGIKSKPKFVHINKIDSAIPQYNLGHKKIKTDIYKELKTIKSVSLVGNYLEGISVNEAIRSSDDIEL